MSLISVEKLTFAYHNKTPLFSNLSFTGNSGEIIAIKGASGSGKTTLLKILCNIIPNLITGELNGEISIDGIDNSGKTLVELSPKISLLMQEPENQLFLPNVEQELAFGAENLCVEPKIILERISKTLKSLKVEQLRNANTATLSFGQKKLVAFAALITLSPDIFLLDEPSAGLSKDHLLIILNEIKRLAKSGKLIIIADHSEQIFAIADKLIALG